MQNQAPTIIVEHSDAIATLWLNRPDKRNAINAQLVSDLCETLKQLNACNTIKVIILAGKGKAFCAGADLILDDAAPPNEAQLRQEIEALQEITRQIVYSPKIIIGAIHGWAVGAGMEWALNCDFTLWAEGAKGFFPEAQWGLSVTGGVSAILPTLVGPIKARELLLFGEKHTAEQFHQLGIAWRVVPEQQLLAATRQVATTLAQLSARSLAHLKRGLQLGGLPHFEQVLQQETDATLAGSLDQTTLENIKRFGQ